MELRQIFKRLRGIIIFGIIYMSVFFLMERRITPINIIYTKLDDLIPFCEYFIIPYVIWFFYAGGTFLYLALTEKTEKEYKRFSTVMMLGMCVFVLTSLIYPNGQNLRPEIVPDNIFKKAVVLLYATDTSTNILPSLHVFVSVACDIALSRDPLFKKHPSWIWASHILSVSICLSTMFLKQHSVIDVIAALFCNAVFYFLVYHWDVISAKFRSRTSGRKN